MLILLAVTAVMMVGNIPTMIGRNVQIQTFGLPMNTKGIVMIRIVFDIRCIVESNMLEDLTRGVVLYLMKKSVVTVMQLSTIPELVTIIIPVWSVSCNVKFLYVS